MVESRHGTPMTADTTDDWFLAQVRPNSFQIAERNLVRQGFRVFCPTQDETKRRAGRFVTRPAPLFPGYLFVQFAPASAPWRAINSTYGVSRLVSFAGATPAPVPKELVAGLLARCDEEGRLAPPKSLAAGDRVEVLSGPFAQFVATVESLAPQRRVWVLLEVLGGKTRVALDADDLRST